MADDIKILTGNYAAGYAAYSAMAQVVAAYPITPQSPVVELISKLVEEKKLNCNFINVESEHSALAVCINASLAGARVFTATSANGLALMHELLHWAAGSRLPIVMCCANRGMAAPWTILNDQQDSISQRDTGWIQLYCEDNQEIYDTVIQAYKIAESLYLPVMVCYDGFILSHRSMPVKIETQKKIAEFLPEYQPLVEFNPDNPQNINPVVLSEKMFNKNNELKNGYMEFRKKLQDTLLEALTIIPQINNEYLQKFNRCYGDGLIKSYKLNDAEYLIITLGSLGAEALEAIELLRKKNIKIGLVNVKTYRPFPKTKILEILKNKKTAVVFEKNISYGFEGALSADIKAAVYEINNAPKIQSVICGLDERNVSFYEIADTTEKIIKNEISDNREYWLRTD